MRRPPGSDKNCPATRLRDQQLSTELALNLHGIAGQPKDVCPNRSGSQKKAAQKTFMPVIPGIRRLRHGRSSRPEAYQRAKATEFQILTARTVQAKYALRTPGAEITWKVEYWRLSANA